MKSIVRGALAIALLGSVAVPAFAADLPSRKEEPVYVAPAPVFTWTGFYVGAEFGGQFGNNTGSIVYNRTAYTLASTGSYSTSGVVGGGLLGYNYQINQFVVGIEGDLTGSSTQGTHSDYLGYGQVKTQYGFGATVRGRLGYSFDHILVYAAGGWAYETIDQTYNNYYINNFLGQKISNDRSGYTVGGGVDYAFNYNWIGRVEYRYNNYGSYTSVYDGGLFSLQQKPYDNVIQAALIYKFGAPAPVVAKY